MPTVDNSPKSEPAVDGATPGKGNVVTEVPDKFKGEDGGLDAHKVLASLGELEKKLGEQGNELGGLRKENEQLKTQGAMTETLAQIAENTKPKGESEQSFDEWFESMQEVWEDNPDRKDRDILQATAKWQAMGEEKVMSKVAELENKLQQELENISGTVKRSAPEYQEHAVRIKEIVELTGVSEDVALKIAQSDANKSDPTPRAPSALPGERVTQTQPDDNDTYWAEGEKEAIIADHMRHGVSQEDATALANAQEVTWRKNKENQDA